jgi:hypothetical protein
LSRHRKIRLGRSKAIVIAAAGALSVATAASAAAATWSPGTQSRAGGPDGPAEIGHEAVRHEAVRAPRLAVTDQLAGPIAEAAARQSSAILAQDAFQLRLTQTRNAIAQRQAAKKRAASKAAVGSPQRIAEAILASFGWSSGQFSCLDPLWEHESGWSVTAANPGSGAYGIPQALPGSRMASAGPDWQANAATQIKWGLGVHQGHLRLALRRLGTRAGHRLVLGRPGRRR